MKAVAICGATIGLNSAAVAYADTLLVIAESHVETHLHSRSPTLVSSSARVVAADERGAALIRR